MTLRFDPTRAVIFDWARGQLRDSEGTPRLNLPAPLVVRLCESAGPEITRDLGRSLGEDVGRRLQAQWKDQVQQISLEAWVEHAGGHLALLGLGSLQLERWGQVFGVRVQQLPAGLELVVEAFLEGLVQRAWGREVSAVQLQQEGDVVFLLLSVAAADRVRQQLQEGTSWGAVLESLHEGAVA